MGLSDILPDSHVFISEAIGFEKPAPEIYGHVIAKLGISPENILMVGDSPSADITGAHKAGMKTCYVAMELPYNQRAGKDDVAPDETLYNFKDLPEIAESLIGKPPLIYEDR